MCAGPLDGREVELQLQGGTVLDWQTQSVAKKLVITQACRVIEQEEARGVLETRDDS